jgi:hypothetical protein
MPLKFILSNILFFVCYQGGPEKFYRTAQRIRYDFRLSIKYDKDTEGITDVKLECRSLSNFLIYRSVPLCALQFPVDF